MEPKPNRHLPRFPRSHHSHHTDHIHIDIPKNHHRHEDLELAIYILAYGVLVLLALIIGIIIWGQ